VVTVAVTGPATDAGGGRGLGVAVALTVTSLIWSGSYAAVKTLQATVPLVTLAAFRCSVAALVLVAVAALAGGRFPRLDRGDWARLGVIGLAGNTLFQLCMIGGLSLTSPAHSALLVSLSPIFAAGLARVRLGEPVGGRRLAGILLAFGGVALLVTRDGAPAAGALLGDVMSLGAAVCWAVYSVLSKPLIAVRSPIWVAAGAMVAGALPLLAAGLPGLMVVPWASLGVGTWALLGYVSALALALNYVLFYWALARAPLARVVVFQYLTPVVAVLIAVVSGYQPATGTLVVSGLAVVSGIALAQRA
jgi:drug/metabolite transporter (DMT)-like permease